MGYIHELKIISSNKSLLEEINHEFLTYGVSDVEGIITKTDRYILTLQLQSYRHILLRGSNKLIEWLKIQSIYTEPHLNLVKPNGYYIVSLKPNNSINEPDSILVSSFNRPSDEQNVIDLDLIYD